MSYYDEESLSAALRILQVVERVPRVCQQSVTPFMHSRRAELPAFALND